MAVKVMTAVLATAVLAFVVAAFALNLVILVRVLKDSTPSTTQATPKASDTTTPPKPITETPITTPATPTTTTSEPTTTTTTSEPTTTTTTSEPTTTTTTSEPRTTTTTASEPTTTTSEPTTTTTTSEPTTPTSTVPVTTTQSPMSWERELPVISKNDSRYAAFKTIANRFEKLVNKTVNPCDDFYGFVCGKVGKRTLSSFGEAKSFGNKLMVNKLEDENYRKGTKSTALKKLFTAYDNCMKSNFQPSREYFIEKYDDMRKEIGFDFPFRTDSEVDLTNDQLAKAIGYITVHSTDTLLSLWVSTNPLTPQSKRGYALFLGESSTFVDPQTYKKPDWWTESKPRIIRDFMSKLELIAMGLRIPSDPNKIEVTANRIAQVEYAIAKIESPPDGRTIYNEFTKSMAEKKFPLFNWGAYFGELSRTLPNLQKKMLEDNFKFMITKPDVIGKVLETVLNGTLPKSWIADYLYFRFLDTFIKYVPNNANSEYTPYDMLKEAFVKYEKKAEKTQAIVKPILPSADRFTNQTACARLTAVNLPFANARMFIDALFENDEERVSFHKDVSKYVSSILNGFRSQIDALTWMSYESRIGAYDKIDNLVRNIGYPDFVLNDTLLDAYYEDLEYSNKQSFADREKALRRFNYEKELSLLLNWRGRKRDDFFYPPAEVNAWYQPSLNSITLPIGILVEPFYNKDWPSAVKYGSLGSIAGHELTHGFDNGGVLFDGVGRYRPWMDESSSASFDDMAKCVINQYSQFCPLESEGKKTCINGRMTQGENIADNGGIRAAYRAFKNHVSFNGPDPALDHEYFKRLSGEQLFFMGFAQVWCEPKRSDIDILWQLLVDVHSPAPYRVLGTVQNFPAFREAFQCPTGHKYTPKDHCNVWVSDVSSTHGIPTPPPNPVNERTKEEIDPTDGARYYAYAEAANLLEESIDLKKDPCDSFYEYACGKYKKPLSFVYARDRNYLEQANQMSSPAYKKHGPGALTKTINFYEKCVDVWSHYRKDIADGKIVKAAIQDFAEKTKFTFNMVENQQRDKKVPELNKSSLAVALGDLSSKGISTLLSLIIDTDWANPEHGYLLYVDQNTLFYPKSYYKPDAWKTIEPNHLENTVQWFLDYAAVMKTDLDEKILRGDIEKLFDLELKLAQEFSTNETERRQFRRSYNVKTIAEAQKDMTFIDLKQYFKSYAGSDAKLRHLFEKESQKIAVMEPNMIKRLSETISKYTDNQKIVLVDYLFYRILMEKRDFLPRNKNHQILETRFDIPLLGRPRQRERLPLPDPTGSDEDEKKRFCAYMTLEYLPLANARFFIDYLYPTPKDREKIRALAKGIINNVAKSFQSMVDRLDWMDDESKKGAYGKITDLQVNVAYPDLIMDEQALNDYFNDLSFTDNDTYFTMLDKIDAFNFNKINSQLLKDKYDRRDFLGPAGTVNAWYTPELNSITFPAGILRQPFFDENWPTSMNYGALGVVAGHEVTHGFDDQGVQWDGKGKLNDWMKEKSKESFETMAKCVIEEYNKFCPLKNTSFQPQCVNGEQTQGGNIADSGGIRAAFEGYRNQISLNGPDPQLPGRLMSRFSHDQLFFLSFAQLWCQEPYPEERVYRQLMVDLHSPSEYRIFGTIQNFPEFRAAFNCPAGTRYGPERGKFCPVWVPQV